MNDLKFAFRQSLKNPSFTAVAVRSEEHTSELQSRFDLVCRLLLEKKKNCSSPAECVTEAVAQQHLSFIGALCRDLPTFSYSTVVPPPPDPTLTYYLVTVDCDAPYLGVAAEHEPS